MGIQCTEPSLTYKNNDAYLAHNSFYTFGESASVQNTPILNLARDLMFHIVGILSSKFYLYLFFHHFELNSRKSVFIRSFII